MWISILRFPYHSINKKCFYSLIELTIMVNNPKLRLVELADCKIKQAANGRRKITNGPIYDLKCAQDMLKAHGLRVVNSQADADMQNEFDPEMTDDELSSFIFCLTTAHYLRSEYCLTSSPGMTVCCDEFGMRWNRLRGREWEHGQKIYVKFGFRENNPRCLVVSVHKAKW